MNGKPVQFLLDLVRGNVLSASFLFIHISFSGHFWGRCAGNDLLCRVSPPRGMHLKVLCTFPSCLLQAVSTHFLLYMHAHMFFCRRFCVLRTIKTNLHFYSWGTSTIHSQQHNSNNAPMQSYPTTPASSVQRLCRRFYGSHPFRQRGHRPTQRFSLAPAESARCACRRDKTSLPRLAVIFFVGSVSWDGVKQTQSVRFADSRRRHSPLYACINTLE